MNDEQACPVCKHTGRRHNYCFDRASGTRLCWSCAILHPPVLRRAIIIALLVGTILTPINQGAVLLQGNLTWLTAVKIGLTYLVPFGISSGSALAANRV